MKAIVCPRCGWCHLYCSFCNTHWTWDEPFKYTRRMECITCSSDLAPEERCDRVPGEPPTTPPAPPQPL